MMCCFCDKCIPKFQSRYPTTSCYVPYPEFRLLGYYRAISVEPSHNYYLGRAESDITPWLEYFTDGMAFAFEKVVAQMATSKDNNGKDYSLLMRKLPEFWIRN